MKSERIAFASLWGVFLIVIAGAVIYGVFVATDAIVKLAVAVVGAAAGIVTALLNYLVQMDKTLKGNAVLKPVFEDHFIELEMLGAGHVDVRGHVLEYSEMPQSLKFEFKTDQPCLAPLIRELKNGNGSTLLNYVFKRTRKSSAPLKAA